MEPIKRFIAGARCPHCEEADKIRCWREDGAYKSECVACGVVDEISADGSRVEAAQVITFPADGA